MTDAEFRTILNEIVTSLEEKGYKPYKQIYGYIHTGNINYITRHGKSRDKIKLLDKERLKLML